MINKQRRAWFVTARAMTILILYSRRIDDAEI